MSNLEAAVIPSYPLAVARSTPLTGRRHRSTPCREWPGRGAVYSLGILIARRLTEPHESRAQPPRDGAWPRSVLASLSRDLARQAALASSRGAPLVPRPSR